MCVIVFVLLPEDVGSQVETRALPKDPRPGCQVLWENDQEVHQQERRAEGVWDLETGL